MELRVMTSPARRILESIAGDLAEKRLNSNLLRDSTSQLGQDILALAVTANNRSGYFIEFGAGDGTYLSNTLLLESTYGWEGILAEPNPRFEEDLRTTRNASIDTRCVWTTSGKTVRLKQADYLTSMEYCVAADHHAAKRARAPSGWFTAQTVSLVDLLVEHNAPSFIDFLSIDTEGSEYDILSAFPWNSHYSINCIAVEHNHSANRRAISRLLVANGYVQVGMAVSGHDDWFVKL